MKTLRPFFPVVDIGFIAYWPITSLYVIPDEYLLKDYDNPILMAWNWFLAIGFGYIGNRTQKHSVVAARRSSVASAGVDMRRLVMQLSRNE